MLKMAQVSISGSLAILGDWGTQFLKDSRALDLFLTGMFGISIWHKDSRRSCWLWIALCVPNNEYSGPGSRRPWLALHCGMASPCLLCHVLIVPLCFSSIQVIDDPWSSLDPQSLQATWQLQALSKYLLKDYKSQRQAFWNYFSRGINSPHHLWRRLSPCVYYELGLKRTKKVKGQNI